MRQPVSSATGRQEQPRRSGESSLRSLWLGALGRSRERPLSRAHQPLARVLVCTPGLLCLPHLSSAPAMPFPTQLSHWPGQLNTWGQKAQEAGNGPPSQLHRFLIKTFFFTYWKTLSNLLYISTGSLPLPPNRLWGFSLKQGEDAPWFFRAQNCKVTKFELGVH